MVASSNIHRASLIDASLHSPALMQMLDISVTRALIEHVVDNVVETVDFAMGRPSTSTRGRSLCRDPHHAAFTAFAANVIHKAEVTVPVLLTTLVYIARARPHLQISLEKWACERVFLGALIAANKYLNDRALKNVHWAICSGVFGKRDIGRIEREFLDVLDFELGVSETDLLAHHANIMAFSQRVRPTRTRMRARTPFPTRRACSAFSSDSSDSSDLDSDSDDSFASSPSPCTPPHAPYAPTPAKPSLPHIADAHVDTVQSHPMSAALELLMAFPMPASHPCQSAHHHPRFTATTTMLA
ncbi:hypothetical protein BKA93DRAFT_164682 [Sparassis latifolia]